MDQGTPAPQVTATGPAANGLADQIAAVEMARQKLGDDLDRFTEETRAEMGLAAEKIMYKVATGVVATAAGIGVKKVLTAAWAQIRGGEPPDDSGDRSNSLGDALAWAIAVAVGAAVAKVVAERGTAVGWEKATGHRPPV